MTEVNAVHYPDMFAELAERLDSVHMSTVPIIVVHGQAGVVESVVDNVNAIIATHWKAMKDGRDYVRFTVLGSNWSTEAFLAGIVEGLT